MVAPVLLPVLFPPSSPRSTAAPCAPSGLSTAEATLSLVARSENGRSRPAPSPRASTPPSGGGPQAEQRGCSGARVCREADLRRRHEGGSASCREAPRADIARLSAAERRRCGEDYPTSRFMRNLLRNLARKMRNLLRNLLIDVEPRGGSASLARASWGLYKPAEGAERVPRLRSEKILKFLSPSPRDKLHRLPYRHRGTPSAPSAKPSISAAKRIDSSAKARNSTSEQVRTIWFGSDSHREEFAAAGRGSHHEISHHTSFDFFNSSTLKPPLRPSRSGLRYCNARILSSTRAGASLIA